VIRCVYGRYQVFRRLSLEDPARIGLTVVASICSSCLVRCDLKLVRWLLDRVGSVVVGS
jgi:hypothetical protein